MDVSLNSINAITDKIFIKQLTGALISFAKDGPANLFMMVAYPFWLISGRKADQIALKKAKIYKNVKISAMPVGIVAVPVILYLTLLFLFG